MKKIEKIVKSFCDKDNEQEWFEFKEDWFEPVQLGEYISALSNSAAYNNEENAYFIWGVSDKTHEIVGTTFNQYRDYNKEPYQNYLARNLSPSIGFEFEELILEGKRVVVLTIPAAKTVPTAFDGRRYIRIGSSKVNLKDYPEREKKLFRLLDQGIDTIENTPAQYQKLTFRKLFGYFGSKGIILREETFEDNLGLKTSDGEYNLMAQLLSDNSHMPLRVSIFTGTTKGSNLFSVREFGNDCLLYSLDELLRYGDVLNIIQADERDRVVGRKDVPLFDDKAFREAIINAILHNAWVEGNEPMVTVYSDRIEIMSRGTLAPKQTMEGFFLGRSIPVNKKLSEIFIQLHISEKSGRGVPKIVETYGREAFKFEESDIVVTIPFNRVGEVGNNVGDKVGNKVGINHIVLNKTRQTILSEMRNNPNVTKAALSRTIGISTTAIDNNISFLKKNGYIERVGSNKAGYWKVNELQK